MQQMHSTSDLLRLLAAEGRPFEEVATAVAHRFGADAESKGWLARTLITLLRDGLLFSEAEKMNAAYLLRFAAPRASGARETLLHLSLPESGEPAGVQAWAASLAGVASAPLPSQLQQYSPAPALMHQSSPQQVLGEATAPLDSQVQFCGLPLGSPPPLPWQGVHAAAAASAAAAAAAAAGWQQVAGSEGVASPWSSSQSSPPAVPPWHQTAHQLQQPCSPQQLPSPQQPLSPMQLAQQQQHQESAGLPIQQQREEEQQQQMQHLHRLLALLQQAVQAPLVPALQQELTLALHGPLAAALTAEAVNGSSSSGGGGSGGGGLQPEHVRGLTEHNSSVAAELLLALTEHQPDAAAVFAASVAELPMSTQSVECLSAVVARAEVPDWVLTTFLGNCMQDTNASQDAGRQSRQVKLLCACVALVLQRQPAALAESLPELLAFCIQQSRHKQASELYRQLRDLEQAVG